MTDRATQEVADNIARQARKYIERLMQEDPKSILWEEMAFNSLTMRLWRMYNMGRIHAGAEPLTGPVDDPSMKHYEPEPDGKQKCDVCEAKGEMYQPRWFVPYTRRPGDLSRRFRGEIVENLSLLCDKHKTGNAIPLHRLSTARAGDRWVHVIFPEREEDPEELDKEGLAELRERVLENSLRYCDLRNAFDVLLERVRVLEENLRVTMVETAAARVDGRDVCRRLDAMDEQLMPIRRIGAAAQETLVAVCTACKCPPGEACLCECHLSKRIGSTMPGPGRE